jgi:hypothetical protein
MDVAPAAAEKAVEAGAVVEAVCVQQYAAAAAWVRQQAACVCAAAGGGGRGNDCDGRQAASVHAAVGSGCGVHATACSGGSVCAAEGRSGRQHDCNRIQQWQRPAGGTIAMGRGSSDGAKDGGIEEKLR